MGEEKKVKYYHIRASVMWLVLVLIGILFLIGIFTTSRITVLCASHEETENAQVETMHMEYGHINSKLENTKECYLCGNSSRSLMRYYRKFDTIGIIGLNEWNVLDLRLKKYDEKGIVMEDQDGTSSSFGNTQGVDYNISSTPSRGKASATISSTNGMFDKTCIQKNLCQECLDKVTDTLEGYFEKGKEEYLPFCLIDFETLDIYPMQKMNRAYYVRDYWVELDYKNRELEVEVYYLPERKF